ncbi:TonB-dependent receptor domain-containing protein [Terrimonas alba]|uniref:TonB-dependent receptor domain-containing protein n=1 Tax=Terrimonas alba TaxID=3349636 RepID=UPI0035F2B535
MKLFKYIAAVIVLLLLANHLSYSQESKKTTVTKDNTAFLKVQGACEMCKHRIEEAAKGKGISSASWDVNTKILSLVYEPSATTLEKVHRRIAAAGHDTELGKANDAVYNELPACCHYRETEGEVTSGANNVPDPVKGVVLQEDKKGVFKPLQGASVNWMNTGNGTMTDSSGVFKIKQDGASDRLVISYVGYKPDTIMVTGGRSLMVVLASGNQLGEVKITARQKATYLSAINPIRTQVMTEKELFKAACCNLSESFETNPSVDVSYSDAVTGAKQIQLLGLSGNYTQLTVENLPGPRGIATPMGLSTIAGPWVESIQLTKGIGSVANGYESIAGQINVELRKPEKMEKLYANAYVNNMGKTDLNLTLSQKIGKKWSTALLLHNAFLNNKEIDFNKDGFRDLPVGNLFSAINRWKYEDNKGFMAQIGVKFLDDTRTGGDVMFKPREHKFSTHHYGLGIDTRRYEGFAKIGYVFPGKKYKSIGLQLSAFQHDQDSYFGLTTYNAEQKNFYANLIYQSIIGTTAHKFRTGMSFVADNYDEIFNANAYKRTEKVAGAFFEYTYTPVEKLNVVAGLRADHNSLFGWFATPRLHVRFEPVRGTTVRFSAGRGQRTANIFAENSGLFVSARQVNIIGALTGKAYGLDPEVAWNKGITIDQKLKLFQRDAMISVDYFRNDFDKQVVVDMENIREVNFYNLQGKSYSNSFQAELNMEPVRKLDVRLAYRYFDVKTTYGDKLLQKPFTSPHRAFANLAYDLNGWKFDYTINYNSSKRITRTNGNPEVYQRGTKSPDYFLMNAQVSKTFGKKRPFDLYVGGENLTNFFQKDAIIAADQPFGPHFDASMVWGPVSGRLFYIGWRYKIK